MEQAWTARPLRLPLAAAALAADHAAHDQEGLLEELWQRPGTLVLPLRGDAALVDEQGRLALLPPAEVAAALALTGGEPLRISLGRVTPAEGVPDDGILVAGGAGSVPVLAALLDEASAAALPAGRWQGLRTVGALLDPRDAGLLTRAVALANWHAGHAYSPRSGRPTLPGKAGWVRIDPEDGGEHFPRTDPAVIVAVTDDDERLLLASNAAWEERRYSLIAGFVDPGESLEAAVLREVREEAGLRVREPRYLGSQPWPFPASLMLGFAARLDGGTAEQTPDGVEIRALRWFDRAELAAAAADGSLLLPGPASIARAIIEAWLGAELPQAS